MTVAIRRLLFVDDAVDVLDGLRNALRVERHAWRMRFATSGEEALRLLEEEPAEVVVTDMRMPGMDGLELLRRVQRGWPGTLRMVLSGQADLATVVQASAAAHRQIAKPCDLPELRAVLRSGFECFDRVPEPEVRRFLGALGSLTPGRGAIQALEGAIASGSVDPRVLAPIAESDAAVTARILQFANSPYCGLSQPVLSVRAAIAYLGPFTVRKLLATLEQQAGPGTPGDPAAAREAAIAARLTRRIAPGHREGDAAFAAALLQRGGALGLEIRHAACLLGLWGVPEEIVETVKRLEPAGEEGAAPSDAVGIVRCATWLAREAAGPPDALAPREAEALRRAAGDRLEDWRRMAAEEAAASSG